jgi:hypothetical protein
MIRTYSYPRIVGALTWRGMLIGGGIGALYGGALSFPTSAIHWMLLAGGAGTILGIVDGLFISGTTWLCRPVYQPDKFKVFCVVSITVLTVVVMLVAMPLLLHTAIANPITWIWTLIATLSAAVSSWAVAEAIAERDRLFKPEPVQFAVIELDSYRAIVGAVMWRGVKLGAGLGALWGTLMFPLLGTLLGLVFGGIPGVVMGLVDGLFIASVTRLWRPIEQRNMYILFCTAITMLLTFIGTGLIFAFVWRLSVPGIALIPMAIAALSAGWTSYRVTASIVAGDLRRKNETAEESRTIHMDHVYE